MAVSEHPNVALLQGPPGTGKTHAAVGGSFWELGIWNCISVGGIVYLL